MKIKLRHIGGSPISPSKIIELTIEGQHFTIQEEITNLFGEVSGSFIESLREIADELESQNELIEKKNESI